MVVEPERAFRRRVEMDCAEGEEGNPQHPRQRLEFEKAQRVPEEDCVDGAQSHRKARLVEICAPDRHERRKQDGRRRAVR